MNRIPAKITATCLLLAFLLFSPLAAGDDNSRAVSLFKEGNTLRKAEKYDEALAKYQAAYRLLPSFKIDYNIALTMRKLGRNAEAARAYERFLVLGKGKSPLNKITIAKQKLRELKKKISAVTVKCNVENCSVTVDGKRIGTTPLKRWFYMEPGRHVVAVHKRGYLSEVKTVVAQATRPIALSFDIRKDPSTIPAPDGAPRKVTAGAWFYVVGTGRRGPVTAVHIKRLYRAGKLDRRTQVWRKGAASWSALAKAPEFRDLFTTPSPAVWHYTIGTRRHGPVAVALIKRLYRSGTLDKQTKIWRDGMERWSALATIPDFADLFTPESADWFYANGPDRHGPFTTTRIRRLHKAGKLTGRTRIWRKGMKKWSTLATVDIFTASKADPAGRNLEQAYDRESTRYAKTMIGYTLLTFGTTFLVGGGILLGVSAEDLSDAKDRYYHADSGSQAEQEAEDDKDTARGMMTAGAIVGGVGLAAAGVAVWALLTRPADSKTVAIVPTHGGFGLQVSGVF